MSNYRMQWQCLICNRKVDDLRLTSMSILDACAEKGIAPDDPVKMTLITENMTLGEPTEEGACDPINACQEHGRCWTHSEWEDGTPTKRPSPVCSKPEEADPCHEVSSPSPE